MVGKELREVGQIGCLGQPGVVVEEEQHLPSHFFDAGIAPTDPDVLRQVDGADVSRQAGGLPTVAHHHQIHRNASLGAHRSNRAVQLGWPRTLCEDHDADARQHARRRSHDSTETRRESTIAAAATPHSRMATMDNAKVAAPAPTIKPSAMSDILPSNPRSAKGCHHGGSRRA